MLESHDLGEGVPTASQQSPHALVLAAVTDLMFVSKIAAAAKHAGVAVQFFADYNRLRDALAQQREAEAGASHAGALVIVDLNDERLYPAALIEKLKRDPATASARIIGFVSHVQHERKRQAEQAGCDLVLPRSVFSQNLYDILRGKSCYEAR